MRALLLACLSSACVVAQTSPAPPAKAPPAGFQTLVNLKTPYQADADRLERERTQALAKVTAAYAAELDKTLKDLTKLGDLDNALVFKAEKEKLAQSADVFTEPPGTAPARILLLRAKYDQTRKPILENAKKRIELLNKQYFSSLDQLQRQFMAYNLLKEAAEVKAEHERVVALAAAGVAPAKPTPLTPEAARKFLSLPEADWIIEGDALFGHVGGGQPHKNAPGKSAALGPATELHFSLSMSAKWYQGIIVWVDDARCQYSRGHWKNKESMLLLDGQEQHLPGKVEVADGWNTLAAVVKNEKIQFYYDGKLEFEAPLQPPKEGGYVFKVGFTSFNDTVRVKDVSCDVRPAKP